MSNRRKEESDDPFETIFSTILNDMEKKMNGIDLSKFNVNADEFKKEESHYDLAKEFQKLENDKDINRSHPEMMDKLKLVMILMDAVKEVIPPNN